MSSNIFFKFDNFNNLYINGSTFDIESNVDNLQVQLNTNIDCVAYIDVRKSFFNNVFSYVVKNTSSTTDISAIIYSGGSEDIHYYVDFKKPYDISKNTYTAETDPTTWNNVFTWFNPAYARCPPRSMKINDITIENRIVHSAYPINGNIVPRLIIEDTNIHNMYRVASNVEIIVGKGDKVYMDSENISVFPAVNGINYYTNCLLIRTGEVGIIPVSFFEPKKDIMNSADLWFYYNNLKGDPATYYKADGTINLNNKNITWSDEIHTNNDRIQRILTSDRVIDEYIRYLSYCLTDSPNNIDLISNYYEIQQQLSVFCGSDAGGVVMSRLKNKLLELDVSTHPIEITPGRERDNSGNWFVNNLYNQSSNITRTLLIQASQLGRGYNITAEDIEKGNRVPFNFEAGDRISFTFTINPPGFTSETANNYNKPGWRDFQEVLIKPRKYRIFANIINN